ncbi:uncharacterized protein LOC111640169 [Centruroides sculpturatus]|uniref:uncharacterized protein LOC111640169 n=1 Tax=Centruroides sculpturatus TaxID=218467 RepID=UPI000C6EC705|nr:uncharacterized protein LOC111640169 [Centruroides sculpturatus]
MAVYQNPQLYILSLYFTPEDEDESCIAELEKVIEQLNSNNYILVGDVNAKSPNWFHPREDYRGRLINNLMDSHDLFSASISNYPTFFMAYAEGWTDVFLAPIGISGNIITCKTLLQESASEHRFIYAKMTRTDQKMVNYRYTRKTNWDLFAKYFADHWRRYRFHDIESEEDMNEYTEHITKAIQEAERLSTRMIKTDIKRTIWWTNNLSEQQKNVRKLRKKMTRARNDELRNNHKEEYRKALKEYKKDINSTHIEAWRDFCGKELRRNPWNVPYRVIFNKMRKCQVPNLIGGNGNNPELDIIENTRRILQFHFPIDDKTKDSDLHKKK